MINIILALLAFLFLATIILLIIKESPKSSAPKSDAAHSSHDKSLSPSAEKLLQNARVKLSEFESDHFKISEMNHGEHHIKMSLRQEYQGLVDKVRDAESGVYGEPITSASTDWREGLQS